MNRLHPFPGPPVLFRLHGFSALGHLSLRKDELPNRRILKSQLMVTCHLYPLTHILRLSPSPNSGGMWDITPTLLHLGKLRSRARRLTQSHPPNPCRLGLILSPPDPQPNTLSPTLLPFETPSGKQLCLLVASCAKFRFPGNFYLVFQLCSSPLGPGWPLLLWPRISTTNL